jgi:hypothetical protein
MAEYSQHTLGIIQTLWVLGQVLVFRELYTVINQAISQPSPLELGHLEIAQFV